ncbi:MAG: hypothetical protein HY913_21070 [Desulfomonile tiedjei]|nr:hypothetical protein [Desulfomonile tiedjei]
MDLIRELLAGITLGPLKNILNLMSLPPERLWASLILLSSIFVLNDLVRTALMTKYTKSVVNHVIINVLTLLPAIVLGLVLLYAGYRYPERAWLNFAIALALYFPWYVGGTLTRLARRDTEGADVGWMAMGLFITVPCGVLAVVLFRLIL